MTSIYQVDAFTEQLFGGNPAAVVPLSAWPGDALLQAIASENNLAETAFIVSLDGRWEIRWFTPTAEVSLCGHATLAAAHVAFKHLGFSQQTISFFTRESGALQVTRLDGDQLSMSFPSIPVVQHEAIDAVATALRAEPRSVWKGHYSDSQFDYLAVFDTVADVANLRVEESLFSALGSRGVIATAAAEDCDFVSRYFAPAFGIPEDPVTGSAHCLLAPFWAEKFAKSVLSARQISARGGVLQCQVSPDRVLLVGQAVDYMKGEIFLPQQS